MASFPLFRYLPAELRLQIWNYALDDTARFSSIVRVKLNERDRPYRFGNRSALIRTCSESRTASLNLYDPQLKDQWSEHFFDYNRSILYFGPSSYHKTAYANSHFLNCLEPAKIKSMLFLYPPKGPLNETINEIAFFNLTVHFSCRHIEEIIICPIVGTENQDPIPEDIDSMNITFGEAPPSYGSYCVSIFSPATGSTDKRLKRGEKRIMQKLEADFALWAKETRNYTPPQVRFLRLPRRRKPIQSWGMDLFSNFVACFMGDLD